jgi:hypothetical protein
LIARDVITKQCYGSVGKLHIILGAEDASFFFTLNAKLKLSEVTGAELAGFARQRHFCTT